MREHPIPQDVTGYKFHIVGNMTLKQFVEIAAGVVVAVILYNTNLVFFVKWPLIIGVVGFGAALAFLPIEERPLDHWVITFFKRLYSPTKFYWKKKNDVPFAFTHKKTENASEAPEVEIDLNPARRKRIQEYFHSIQNPAPATEPWEQAEQVRVFSVLQAFDEVEVSEVEATPQKVKPNLTPRIRNLSSQQTETEEKVVFERPAPATQPEPETPPVEEPVEATPVSIQENKVEAVEKEEEPATQPQAQAPVERIVPQPDIQATPLEQPEPEIDELAPPPELFPTDDADISTATDVKQNTTLPFPEAPQEPNKVVGMVLTHEDKLIDRAVITLRNQQGAAVRSVKTNLLGQFFVTGTLPNGTYLLDIKKEGFAFPEQQLVLNGSPVPPLEIRSVVPSE